MTDRSTDDCRMQDYLRSLEPEKSPLLREMRLYAHKNHIPIVRDGTESALRTLTALKSPDSILEIGTAIGYSAIVMAEVCSARITTVESYDKRIPQALAYIGRAGLGDRIDIVHKDAGIFLKESASCPDMSFDMIFLDAAKGQYVTWLPDILRLMRQGSVLIADNVLQERTVIESRYVLPHRPRSTHGRMREFLYAVKHDAGLSTCVLTVGDGISVSVMI